MNRLFATSLPVARSRKLAVITNYTERTSSLGPESLFTRFSQTRAIGWNRYLCRYYVAHYLVNFSGFRAPLSCIFSHLVRMSLRCVITTRWINSMLRTNCEYIDVDVSIFCRSFKANLCKFRSPTNISGCYYSRVSRVSLAWVKTSYYVSF